MKRVPELRTFSVSHILPNFDSNSDVVPFPLPHVTKFTPNWISKGWQNDFWEFLHKFEEMLISSFKNDPF